MTDHFRGTSKSGSTPWGQRSPLRPGAPWFGPIVGCRLRDDLVARTFSGDSEAFRLLLHAVPFDMPSSVVKAWRNRELRRLADWLRSVLPDATDHGVAKLLSAAGSRLAAGRSLSETSPFNRLSRPERQQLAHEIEGVLSTCPAWPAKRQMIDILSR